MHDAQLRLGRLVLAAAASAENRALAFSANLPVLAANSNMLTLAALPPEWGVMGDNNCPEPYPVSAEQYLLEMGGNFEIRLCDESDVGHNGQHLGYGLFATTDLSAGTYPELAAWYTAHISTHTHPQK